MHRWDSDTEGLAELIVAFTRHRLSGQDSSGLSTDQTHLESRADGAVTPGGLGLDDAFALYESVIAPARIAIDDPRYLALIATAPTPAAALFDLAVSASGTYGGTSLEGAGAVYAENQALRWIADLAGMPAGAGGCFVPGGTHGNLSALAAARETWATRNARRPDRWRVAVADGAHSSILAACRAIDAEVVPVATDESERMTGAALADALAPGVDGLVAVVATAGTTNLGLVDDLAGVAAVCRDRGLWLHVDGAYGAAALAAPSARHRFAGIECADSLIVDPHKWLFSPFDCCALLYREPALARAAHRQHASYLEATLGDGQWNPSDYAIHLTRRPRGLPFWFSLVAHGTEAYAAAVEQTLALAQHAAAQIRAHPDLELVCEPELSVVAFRRRGWSAAEYERWSHALLADDVAFVLPSQHRGEPIARLAFVNPRTTTAHIGAILATTGSGHA